MTDLSRCGELVPLDRFIRLLAMMPRYRAIVGDQYAVLVIELDELDFLRARYGHEVVEECRAVVTRRLREALPPDALMAQLRDDAFGILAFGALDEVEAMGLASRMQEYTRVPIATTAGALAVRTSIGISFTSRTLSAVAAMQIAERAARHVRLNGGDATYIARFGVPDTGPSHEPSVTVAALQRLLWPRNALRTVH